MKGCKLLKTALSWLTLPCPGREEMSNADRIEYTAAKDSTRYTWEIKPGEKKTLKVTAILEKDKSRNRFVWGVAAGFILLLMGICFLVSYRLKKKRQ
jgi:type VI protein secretion system component VasF